jgi:hypothetical protein
MLLHPKQILLDIKGELAADKIIVGDFNTTLSSIDKFIQKW